MTDSARRIDVPTNATVLNLAWPLALKTMMTHGIIVIDAYLVSALGEPALAAMGLAGSIAGLLLGVIFAFANATQIRVAQAFGSGSEVALKTAFYCGLIVNLVAASVGILLAVTFGGMLIDAFAHTEWIAEQARRYLNIFLLVVVLEAVGQCFGSFFNGCGRTRTPALSFALAIPVNIAVSFVLIHGHLGLPELGVAGAAVGSVVASLLRAAFLGVGFFRLSGAYRHVAGWKNNTLIQSLKRHTVFALPIAGTFISMNLANNVCMLIYAKMSVNQFAAMTLIQPWILVAGSFTISWAMATGITVAQLLGSQRVAGTLDQFLRNAWKGAALSSCVVSLIYLAICLSADRIYTGLEAETTAALLLFIPFLMLLPFPRGSNAMCGHTLRAGGDTLFVMNLFAAATWGVRVPLTALFILVLDLSAAWVVSLILLEELVKAPSLHRRLIRGEWKTRQPLD